MKSSGKRGQSEIIDVYYPLVIHHPPGFHAHPTHFDLTAFAQPAKGCNLLLAAFRGGSLGRIIADGGAAGKKKRPSRNSAGDEDGFRRFASGV